MTTVVAVECERSVQDLLSDLALRSIPRGTKVGKTRLDGGKNTTSAKTRRLVRIAYNVLLFSNSSTSNVVDGDLTEREGLLAFAFALRCRRRSEEAERLEELVTRVANLSPDFRDNVKTVLRFLLCLSSSNEKETQNVKEPLNERSLQKINTNPTLQLAPYNYGEKPSQVAFSFYYTHFPKEIFEKSLATFYDNENAFYNTIEPKIFEANPSTHYDSPVAFTSGHLSKPSDYLQETTHKLFGALVHRLDDPWNVGVKLEIPELGDTSPSVSLSSKTYSRTSSKSQSSEDEGFIEIETPTSSDSSVPLEELDVWESALTVKEKNHFRWESVGNFNFEKEKPFLSESGSKGLDELSSLMQYELSLLDPTVDYLPAWKISTEELIRDCKYILLGVSSTSFRFSPNKAQFTVVNGLGVAGITPLSLKHVLQEFISDGTLYWRLWKFSSYSSTSVLDNKGLVFKAFSYSVGQYLQYYHAAILTASPCDSLLQLLSSTSYVRSQLRHLAEICCIDSTSSFPNHDQLPTGVYLISRLYSCALESMDSELYPVLLFLLRMSCLPFLRFLHQWVYFGICTDEYNEFLITPNHEYLLSRDYFYWTKGFVLSTSSTSVPSFLKETMSLIFLCGKSLGLLKLCCPQHHLCTIPSNLPSLSLTFCEKELNRIESRTLEYVTSMEKLAVTHKRTRKQLMEEVEALKILRKEQAYKEATANMQRIQRKLEDERKLIDTRKRQQMAQLQEQIEIVRVRRKSEREQQEADDKAWEEKERIKTVTAEEVARNVERPESRNQRRTLHLHPYSLKGEAKNDNPGNTNNALSLSQGEKYEDKMQMSPDQASVVEMRMQITPDLTPSSETPGTFSQFSEDPMSISVTTMEDAFTPSDVTDIHIEITEILNNVTNLIMCTSDSENDHLFQDPNANLINNNINNEIGSVTSINNSDQILPFTTATAHNDNYLMTGTKQKHQWNNSNYENTMHHENAKKKCLQEKDGAKNNDAPKLETKIVASDDNTHRNKKNIESGETEKIINTEEITKDISTEQKIDSSLTRSLVEVNDKTKPNQCEESTKTPDLVELALLDVGVLLKPRGRNEHGHSSDASIQNVMYESKINTLSMDDCSIIRSNTPDSLFSESAESESALIEHRTFAILKSRGRNAHGHASDSTIQKILYGDKENDTSSTSSSFEPIKTTTTIQFLSPTIQPYNRDFSFETLECCELKMDRHKKRQLENNEYKTFIHSSLPLPVVIERSLLFPLHAQINLVNQSLIDFYLVDLKIMEHIEILRDFILLHDGEFAQSLADQFFEKLARGYTPVKLMNPKSLNAILSRALTTSLHGDRAYVDNLSFAISGIPLAFSPNTAAPFQGLEIQYRIDWPLNLVLTPKCFDLYNQIFHFFMQIRHLHWALNDIFYHLKRNIKFKKTTQSPHFIQMQLFRHQMHHFVRVVQAYVSHQVFQVSWSELQHDISHNIKNLDDLCRVHIKYLKHSITRCLLSPKAAPIMTMMQNVFSIILKFHAQMTLSPWQENPKSGEVEHPAYWRLLSSYNLFKERAQFLFSAIETCVNQGFHPCLQDFLMRLNFNHFYSPKNENSQNRKLSQTNTEQ